MQMVRWALLALTLVACGNENDLLGEPRRPAADNPPDIAPVIVTDTYRQIQQPMVDVLFVVDNSSSMGDEQAALSQNFPLFLDYFLTSGLDYHIGVVATDVQRIEFQGKLRQYNGYSYIDADTPGAPNVFTGMMNTLGTITGSNESGRSAAYMMLETNADLPRNAGFYREAAELHIVFVSDTDDNSGNAPSRSEYMNWFETLKPSTTRVAMHAIVQRQGDSGCGNLRPGFDYLYYVQQTNGVQGSICQDDWTPVLDSLGLETAGLKQEFFLRNIPALTEEIRVQVRQLIETGDTVTLEFEECLAGEELENPDCEVAYNPGRNSIVFLDFVADPLSEVIVTYARREDYAGVSEDVNGG